MTRAVSILCLVLVCASISAGQIGDLDPLVVEVLDPADPEMAARLQGDRLPLIFRGMQPRSLAELQQWMRLVADPSVGANQERDLPAVAPGQHPSNRMLVVRCAPTQETGWVQSVIQAAWLLPWEPRNRQVLQSPLLVDIRVGLLDKDTRAPAAVLRKFRPGRNGSRTWLEDLITSVRAPRGGAVRQRKIDVRLGSYADRAVGQVTGFRMHPNNADAATLAWIPVRAAFRLREQMSALRKRDPNTQVRLLADPQTPFVLTHELLQMVKANELTAVFHAEVALPRFGRPAKAQGPTPPASEPVRPRPPRSEESGPIAAPRVDERAVKDAVNRGLDWLMRQQAKDGRWDADKFPARGQDGLTPGAEVYDVGVTGLSLLAFLQGGHDHRGTGPYRESIGNGLKWLKARQDAEGCFGPRADPHFVYTHALATQAMVRAYAATKSNLWKGPAQDGLDYVMKAQNPYQAWRYGERPGDNDMSITSWMVSALAAGRAAGLDVNETALKWAYDFINELTDQDTGRTGYLKRGERPVRAVARLKSFPVEHSESLTASAIHCRLLCHEAPDTGIIQKGAALVLKQLPRWTATGESADMIYWYYGTLSMKRLGGEPWERWRRHMAATLLGNQVFGGANDGAFRPVGPWGVDGGAIYSTALMTLVLENL
ncbi:MAG: hypothetical protein CMJ83_12495 [Planctomycetes bacterium]|nr:hypothetical protein [Planctomycetota bacterium]